MGLFCPVYITRLEFKSREELQLMPQTQEEHLAIALEDEKEDSDSEHSTPAGPDVEVIILHLLENNKYLKTTTLLLKGLVLY